MFEKDYILRLIQEMVRMVLKLLFHIDTASALELAVKEEENREETERVWRLLKDKRINEAENLLFDLMDTGKKEYLKSSLLFYDYLNGLTDEELEAASFSREEIREGLVNSMKRFGYEDLCESLPMDF